MAFQVKLKNFQGPMDLLLYFIRRDELDIYDIPIASITKEFIEVIDEWKRLNMLVAGEFIDMASILIRIKAKMLIPRPEIDEDGEIIDPREELMQKLIEANSTLLALFIFLPITPSIAAITVFTQSLLNDRRTDVTSISHHTKRVIDAIRY